MASDHDLRCSNACTRAGIALFVLAAVSLGMVRPLNRTEQLNALLKYTSARLILLEQLGKLATDPAWKALVASDQGPKASTEWPLARLLDFTFQDSSPPAESEPKKTELQHAGSQPALLGGQDSATASRAGVPRPPTGSPGLGSLRITVTRRIEPLHTLLKELPHLGDGRSLALARQYSPAANRSIYEWAVLRSDVETAILRRKYPGIVIVRDVPEEQPQSPLSRLFRRTHRDEFHVSEQLPLERVKEITLPELTKLAMHSPPSLQEAETLLKEQVSVTFPSQGVAIGLLTGAILVQIANLLTIIYFWLFYGEALVSPSFPAGATVFGALARTRFTRCIFVLFLAIPPAASAVLASRMLWLVQSDGLLGVVVSGLLATLTLVVAVAIRKRPLPARVHNGVAGAADAD